MNLRIKTIVLWPKNEELLPRTIGFDIEKVNIITGSNGKGKSSIISIVDYCLGSGKCTIPSGIIRQKVKAFGIVLVLNNKEVLLIREEPGESGLSNNFIKLEEKIIDLPETITEYTFNINQIKQHLNEIFGFADIGFSTNEFVKSFDTQRPSFRNAISLNFQPQYLVANQSTMFYKADSPTHREKLKIIFPYLIGAINNKILELKEELKDLKRKLSILLKEKDLNDTKTVRVQRELLNYYRIAQEFGLIKKAEQVEVDQDFILGELNRIVEIDIESIRIPENATSKAAELLFELTKQEVNISDSVQDLGRRLSIIKSIQVGNKDIGDSTLSKRNRISSTGWILDKMDFTKDCPLCGSSHDATQAYLETLANVLNDFEKLSEKVADSAKIYLNERRKLERELNEKESKINDIRNQISALKRDDAEFNRIRQNQFSINRYLGQVELTLSQLIDTDNNEDLLIKIAGLEEEIQKIEDEVGSEKLKNREKYAITKISENIKKYALIFEAEKSNERISLDIVEYLTLKFFDVNGSEKFLWEVGSGHNYMAYHLSTYLGIHEYLLTVQESKVPTFIIFDQPSQAYFPEIKDDKTVSEEDLVKLKKIFKVLSEFNNNTKGKVQVIVLEHAGEESWKDYDNIKKTKRWRAGEEDDALIPQAWL